MTSVAPASGRGANVISCSVAHSVCARCAAAGTQTWSRDRTLNFIALVSEQPHAERSVPPDAPMAIDPVRLRALLTSEGCAVSVVRWGHHDVDALPLPAIVALTSNRYLVITGVGERIQVDDPRKAAPGSIDRETFARDFAGLAIIQKAPAVEDAQQAS